MASLSRRALRASLQVSDLWIHGQVLDKGDKSLTYKKQRGHRYLLFNDKFADLLNEYLCVFEHHLMSANRFTKIQNESNAHAYSIQ